MHIPDGFLDPKMSSGLIGMAMAVLALCVAKVRAAVTAPAAPSVPPVNPPVNPPVSGATPSELSVQRKTPLAASDKAK